MHTKLRICCDKQKEFALTKRTQKNCWQHKTNIEKYCKSEIMEGEKIFMFHSCFGQIVCATEKKNYTK